MVSYMEVGQSNVTEKLLMYYVFTRHGRGGGGGGAQSKI